MKDFEELSQKTRWTIGTLILLLPIFAIISANYASDLNAFSANTDKFVYQNIATGLVTAFAVCSLLLMGGQHSVYRPFMGKSNYAKLDERQKAIRQKVFERSYSLLPIFYLITMVLVGGVVTNHLRLVINWIFIIGFYALPSIIAARFKNSKS